MVYFNFHPILVAEFKVRVVTATIQLSTLLSVVSSFYCMSQQNTVFKNASRNVQRLVFNINTAHQIKKKNKKIHVSIGRCQLSCVDLETQVSQTIPPT